MEVRMSIYPAHAAYQVMVSKLLPSATQRRLEWYKETPSVRRAFEFIQTRTRSQICSNLLELARTCSDLTSCPAR